MADTVRTISALQTLLADNTSGDISPQDLRDMLVSLDSIKEDAVTTGAWTPLVSDGTNTDAVYSTQVGRYAKVGNIVQAQAKVILTSLGSLSGAIKITGLPFTSENVTDSRASATVGTASSTNIIHSAAGYVDQNTTEILLRLWDGTTTSAFTAANLTASGELSISISYIAA